MLLKATFPSSYLGLVETTLATLKEPVHSTTEMKLYGVSNTVQILKFAYTSSMRSDGQHPPIVPSKRCNSASQKQVDTAKCCRNPP